jgi:hypothetical protein
MLLGWVGIMRIFVVYGCLYYLLVRDLDLGRTDGFVSMSYSL